MEIKKNKKKKEESSHSQAALFVISSGGSVRDKVAVVPTVAAQHVPDGTKKAAKKNSKKTAENVLGAPENNEQEIISNSKDKYLYVYGITDNKGIKLDFEGLKGQPIQKLDINGITALFSFYPTLHPMVEEKEVLLHTEILNKLAGKITIVPMAFGTVFKDQEILKIVLTKSYPAAKKTLELIKDKIELGIKVVKKGYEEELSTEVGREILEELNKLSVKSAAGDKFSDRLLLNNSFLVERHKFTNFSDKVGELEEKHQNVKFIYTGPWPAYSFVDINIKVG